LLGGKIPDNVFEKNAFKTVRFEINQGRLYKIYKDRERIFVRELLVDELQDITPEVSQILQSLIASGFTKVIVAADLDQTIYNVNEKVTSSMIELCEKKYELAYCYRSTRQIIEKAAEWLSTFNIKTSNNDVFALSGPVVRFITCEDSSHQVEASANVMRDLQNRYDQNSLALIYCQYSNPSFKGLSKEVEVLKKHPELKHFHHFANTTKGKEYFAGVLFISDTFLKKDLNIEEKRLRINTLYVALTRFRDEVTVVYSEGCAIEPNLKKINQLPEDKILS
jgi:ATP-dependent exoDNAse (exonuclease V) beta subunit